MSATTQKPFEPTPVRVWGDDRLELGEGARWVGDELMLVDVLSGRLLSAGGERPAPLRTRLHVPGTLGAVAPLRDRDGEWLAATGPGIALVSEAGSFEWLGRPEDTTLGNTRMNDAAVDPRGRFWAGSMAADGTPGVGSLYRVDEKGKVQRVLDGLSISNGPAFAEGGTVMYLADSARGEVDRFTLDVETGAIRDRQPFVRLESNVGAPDGMTVDDQGCLWLAVWGGWAVHRYRPNGTLDRVVPLPAAQPTSVCFGGQSRDTLFVSSAYVGLESREETDGAIFATRPGVTGPLAVSAVLS